MCTQSWWVWRRPPSGQHSMWGHQSGTVTALREPSRLPVLPWKFSFTRKLSCFRRWELVAFQVLGVRLALAALCWSRWQHVAPRWAFHFLPLTNASLQPPLVPLSLQVIFTTGQKKKSGDISSRSPLKPLHQLPRKTSWQMALVLGAQRSNKSPELPASHRNAFFRKLRRLGVQAPTPVSDVTLRR